MKTSRRWGRRKLKGIGVGDVVGRVWEILLQLKKPSDETLYSVQWIYTKNELIPTYWVKNKRTVKVTMLSEIIISRKPLRQKSEGWVSSKSGSTTWVLKPLSCSPFLSPEPVYFVSADMGLKPPLDFLLVEGESQCVVIPTRDLYKAQNYTRQWWQEKAEPFRTGQIQLNQTTEKSKTATSSK